ncbi:MAG: hypothetical protein LH614_08705 [Pyrinomonadaceae bacterium]|nr:hypothetical protein [Pyrinomonadaceae bacterium]
MKYGIIQLCLVVFFTITIVNADAQTAVISSGGFVSVSGQIPGTPVSTQNPTGQPIAANLYFGDVSPNGIWSRRVVMRMPIRISSDCNYKVELQRVSFNNISVQPSDIGFGIGIARAQIDGSPNLTLNATNINIAGNFGSNPITALLVNGSPQYQATLNNISESSTLVLTGVPTIAGGNAGDDSNSILIDLIFVIVPQYYTPTDGSNLNLTLIISAQ